MHTDSPGLIWVRTGWIEDWNPGVLPGAACFCCCVTATVAKNGDFTLWPNFCWVRRTFPDCGWGLHRGVYVPAEKQEIWNWLKLDIYVILFLGDMLKFLCALLHSL